MGRAERPNRKAAAAEPQTRRSFVTLPLAQLLPGITRPAFRKRSPAGASLMADWAAIVGPGLALVTEPRRLARGQLTIACAGPVAMELQHLQVTLLDRINTHAGHALVERLRFIQDQVALPVRLPAVRLHGSSAPASDLPGGPLGEALDTLWHAIQDKARGG